MSRKAVENGLAACTNIFPMTSVYEWEGGMECGDELAVLFKTVEERADELRSFIEREHSYDVPCIMEMRPSSVNEDFLKWAEVQCERTK